MSRVNVAVDFGESPGSRIVSAKLLSSVHTCVQRAQLSFEGLGGVSNLFLLTGAGAGLVASLLTGLMVGQSFSPASDRRLGASTSGSSAGTAIAGELP